jgi:pimeloyl-ACP methyl ester carboxylesterase
MNLHFRGQTPEEPMSLAYSTQSLEQNVPFDVVYGQARIGEQPVNYRAVLGGDRLAVIAPGLLGTEGMLDPLANKLAALGYTAVTYGQVRHGASIAENLRNPQLLHTDTFTAVVDALADNPELAHVSDSQLDLMAHSMGTHPAFEYGVKHPEDVRSAIAAGASGIDPQFKHDLLRRVTKFERQVAGMTRRHMQSPGHIRSVAKHTASNVPLFVGELTSCLTSSDNLERARKLDQEGIPTALIGFANDQITPANGLLRAARELDIPYRELASPEAEHDAVITHAGEVALTMADLHAEFDTRRSLRSV